MKIKISIKFMDELKNNTDKTYKISWTKKVLNAVGTVVLVTTICFTTLSGIFIHGLKSAYDSELEENTVIYAEQINNYNQYINKYANEIKKLNLDHLQIIMKVMNDIWNEIDGYAVAKDLPTGYFRLTFQEEGVGVCTSFADDFTARMNAINSEYNARNIIVYMDLNETDNLKIVDIERNILKYPEDNSNIEVSEIKVKLLQGILGNHMVSLIDIPNSDITMMIDTTNLLIGVLKNGYIYVLNNNSDKLLDYKLVSNYALAGTSFGESFEDYFDSFSLNSGELEVISIEYGLDAQEDALNYIRDLDGNQKKLEKY